MKPANVLSGDDGRVKLTDFGIARCAGEPTMTGTGSILGRAAYLAPEVAQVAAVGPGVGHLVVPGWVAVRVIEVGVDITDQTP